MNKINWTSVKEYTDITYKKCNGVARIAFNRPEVRNAFRPQTTSELIDALRDVTEDTSIGCVLISAEGPSPKDGIWSFCSGGDQRVRGKQGYVGEDGAQRLNILEAQRLIRFMPKVVIAVVPGWAVGGGHSLHVVCDMTLASKEHAIFKQTDTDVASFDAGYGSAYFIKMAKYAMNLTDDGMVGQQIFAGEATRLAYMTDEAKEGRDAFLEKRKPNFEQKWIPN